MARSLWGSKGVLWFPGPRSTAGSERAAKFGQTSHAAGRLLFTSRGRPVALLRRAIDEPARANMLPRMYTAGQRAKGAVRSEWNPTAHAAVVVHRVQGRTLRLGLQQDGSLLVDVVHLDAFAVIMLGHVLDENDVPVHVPADLNEARACPSGPLHLFRVPAARTIAVMMFVKHEKVEEAVPQMSVDLARSKKVPCAKALKHRGLFAIAKPFLAVEDEQGFLDRLGSIVMDPSRNVHGPGLGRREGRVGNR